MKNYWLVSCHDYHPISPEHLLQAMVSTDKELLKERRKYPEKRQNYPGLWRFVAESDFEAVKKVQEMVPNLGDRLDLRRTKLILLQGNNPLMWGVAGSSAFLEKVGNFHFEPDGSMLCNGIDLIAALDRLSKGLSIQSL